MNYASNMRAALQAAELRQEFIDWLRTDADRLVAAAQLLGGTVWEDRAISLIDAVACGVEPEELEADLVDLHRLLALEYTDNLDTPEAELFLAVHPDDPRADDARLCAEGIERGVETIRAHSAAMFKEVA